MPGCGTGALGAGRSKSSAYRTTVAGLVLALVASAFAVVVPLGGESVASASPPSPVVSGSSTDMSHGVVVSPHGSWRAVAANRTSSALAFVRSSGGSWQAIGAPPNATNLHSFTVNDSGTVFAVVTVSGGAKQWWKYTGGGWSTMAVPTTSSIMELLTDGVTLVAITTGGRTYKSTNEGGSWTAGQQIGISAYYEQAFLIGGIVHIVWVIGSGALVYTRWDVATGTNLPVDAPPVAPYYQWRPYLFAAEGSTTTLFIAAMDSTGGLYLYKSANSGGVWVTMFANDALPGELAGSTPGSCAGPCAVSGLSMGGDGRIHLYGATYASGSTTIVEVSHGTSSALGDWSPVYALASVPGDSAGVVSWPTQRNDGHQSYVADAWVSVPRSGAMDIYWLTARQSVVPPPAATSFTSSGSTVVTGTTSYTSPNQSMVAVSHSRAWQAVLVTDAATSAQSIVRSNDGTHWMRIPTPVTAPIKAIAIADSGAVYAVTQSNPGAPYSAYNFYRYVGGRWLGHTTYTNPPAFHAEPGTIIRAGLDLIGLGEGSDRVSYSTDDGNTWVTTTSTNGIGGFWRTSCDTTVVQAVLHVLCKAPSGGYPIYSRWSLSARVPLQVVTAPTFPNYSLARLLPVRDGGTDVWIGYLTTTGLVGLIHSSDNGGTWSTVDSGSALPASMWTTTTLASYSMALGGDDRVYLFGGTLLRRVDRALAATPDWSATAVLDGQLGGSPFSTIPTAAAAASPPDVWLMVSTGTNPDTFAWHHYGSLGGPVPILPGQTYGPSSAPPIFALRPQAAVSDPVNSATGSFTDQITDASLPAVGVPLAMTRTYNSADGTIGALGRGWTFTYATSLAITPTGATLRAGDGQQVVYTLNPNGSFSGPPGGLATLVANANGSYTVTTRHQGHHEFDSAGRLTAITDRNGQGVSLTYDASSRVATVAGSGRSMTFGYTGALLSTVTLSDGRYVGYSYTNGLLTDVRDLRGYHTTYTHDAGGRLASVQDANGHFVVRNTYDPVTGRVTDQYDANDNHTTFAWDPATQTATITAPDGGVWRDVYANNVLTTQVNPLGQVTLYSYNTDLRLVAVTNPAGHTTQLAYDSAGNLVQERTPDGATYGYTYNALYNQTSSTTPRGLTTTYGYDAKGNLVSTARPNPAGGDPITTSLTRYPTTGLVNAATDARGKTTQYSYDTQGNLTSATSPLGEQITWSYDAAGRVTSVVSPRGNVTGADPDDYRTSVTYDNADRVLTVTDPIGNVTTATYDPVGNRATLVDAKNRTTSFGYDDANHLTQVTPPAPIGATTYTYTSAGQLASMTQPGNRITTFTHNTAGQLTATTSPLGTTQFGYDTAGNRTSVTSPAGNTVTMGYDSLHRLTSLTYPDATPPVSYTYDSDGNRTSMTDGAGVVTYTYDSLDRLTAVTRGADTFDYSYDVAGNLVTRTFPGQTADTFSYDDDGRLASLVTGATTLASYTYDVESHLTQTNLANGITQTRAWDPAGRLTDVTGSNGATTIARANYTYDATNNPTSMLDAAGTTTSYGYDTLDRLVEACFNTTNCATATDYIRWSYNDVGHRLTETRPTGTTSYTYNSKDQLTQTSGPSGTTTYGYDTNGNQTQAGATTFTFNAAARMTSQTTGATTTSYTYDGDGRRLSATTGTASTAFLWDPRTYQLALERDGSANLLRRYTYGAGLTAMTTPATGTSYYLPDGQGSTLALTGPTGATQWTYRWEPYGLSKTTTKVDPTAPDNPRQWLGEYTETSQVHLRARQYDPATGQFTSPDQGGSGEGYGYANANPLVFTDPLGLDSRDTVETINEVAAQTAFYAGTAAVVCGAIVICAPLSPILGTIAFGAGMVAAGTGIGLAIVDCTSPKGSCPGAIVNATVGAIAAIPGGGGLAKAGQELKAAAKAADGIMARLPAYSGGKTRGILDTGSDQIDLISGYAGPSSLMPAGSVPGMNGRIKSHVEAHAASLMRQLGLNETTLYINRIPCPGKTGCDAMLSRMLPPGAQLHVRGSDGFSKTYTGIPE